jgi:drug/metabolite transporter (DMT)-like permease
VSRSPFLPWLLLALLSLIWGSSFILMKRGLEVYSAQQVAALRLSISFLSMLPLALQRCNRVTRKDWPWLAVVGWAGSGFPAFLFALAQTRISSAVAGILNALTPLFTLVLGMLFFGLPFRRAWLSGILLGLLGVGLIVGQLNGWAFGTLGWYALAALGGTIFYAISGNTVKQRLAHLDAFTIGSLGFAVVGLPALLLLFSSDFLVRLADTPGACQALGYISLLALFGTVFASVLFYYVVQQTNQVFGSMVSYLIPLVALGWGVADGEAIHWIFLAGLVLILAGIHTTRQR